MRINLPEHPSWLKIDSTKMEDYMECARHYLFRYVLGWRSEEPSVHLVFGQVWHRAMRRLLLDGYTEEAILLGWREGDALYRGAFPSPLDDKEREPKVPGKLPDLLTSYVTQYSDDNFKTQYTEIGGTVPLDSRRILFFKMDSIMQDERGYFSLEHKHTGRRDKRWDSSWRLKFQIHTYLHTLYCLYTEQDVYGVIINGLIVTKGKPAEFVRVPVRKTIQQMQSWLTEAISWMEDVERDMDRLSSATADQPELLAFRRKLTGCSDYFGCEYAEICASVPNPLTMVEELPPLGFKVEYWDPSTRELDTRKNIGEPNGPQH